LLFFLIIGCILLVFFVIYALIPSFLTRVFEIRSTNHLRKSHSSIALTFDDGPNPTYTPIILDLLKSHSIKATFFVLGSEAENNPTIIKRIHEEGHLIGIHNYFHTCSWFLSPKVLHKQIEKTAKIIKELTKAEPNYYRPPWGLVSLPIFFQRKYNTILWTVMAYDWNSKQGSKGILERLVKNAKPGSIILLHDNGKTLGADEDAPLNTIEALESFITYCQEKQYQFVRVDEFKS